MNFHDLIHQRDLLLNQVRLANLAFAYQRLGLLTDRIARARLHGLVALRPGDPVSLQPWPTVIALEGSQSQLEEHFLEEEWVEFADILSFLGDDLPPDGLRFRLEELDNWMMPVLRQELASAGVILPAKIDPVSDAERRRGR